MTGYEVSWIICVAVCFVVALYWRPWHKDPVSYKAIHDGISEIATWLSLQEPTQSDGFLSRQDHEKPNE